MHHLTPDVIKNDRLDGIIILDAVIAIVSIVGNQSVARFASLPITFGSQARLGDCSCIC
jgi:hypothetical protein